MPSRSTTILLLLAVSAHAAAPPSITAVLNGASYQSGIEAGSWVTIEGSNLSNTAPPWNSTDIVNGMLPTSLDGVSVTINGKPGFVAYISPTQINLQAPSDTATGTVNVVVNNNGAVSAPSPAQLQAYAPAFFTYSGTKYALATRLPDYTLIGDPSTVPGVVAAQPGDVLVLWGTGFGGTVPAVPAGTVVGGTPALALTAPKVTVGGVAAQVIGTLLSVGSAGLYQVTLQLPASVPLGAAVVQASAGGVQTAAVLIFVANP